MKMTARLEEHEPAMRTTRAPPAAALLTHATAGRAPKKRSTATATARKMMMMMPLTQCEDQKRVL